MINTPRLNPFLLIIIISIVFVSCQSRNTHAKLAVDKRRIDKGDVVKVAWRISGPQKNIKRITLNDVPVSNSMRVDTMMYFDRDTVVELKVWVKNKKRPIYRYRKLKVTRLNINGFMAYRDRFDPHKILLSWDVEGASDIMINDVGLDLDSYGKDSVFTTRAKYFQITAVNDFDTIIEIRYVEPTLDNRPLIIGDKPMDLSMKEDRIHMEIIEADIHDFPDLVKLKVVVYDSLGHFITNLAPPFASDSIANIYFKSLSEKVGGSMHKMDFEVREIHESPDLFDIAMVLDYSGSMSEHISSLEQSTKKFINQKYDQDRYSVVKFDHRLAMCSNLSKNKYSVLAYANFKGLDTLGGGTAMYAAINKGLQSLRKGKNERVVLLFTDGYENSSMAYLNQYSAFINQVIDSVRANNARLIIVGLGDVNRNLLSELVHYTNGSFYHLGAVDEIDDVYKEISHNFRTYYEIIIRPKSTKGEHLVELEYYNNKQTVNTQRPFNTGEGINLIKFEEDSNLYWYNKQLKQKGYNLVSSPQTLVNFALNEDQIESKYYQALDNTIGLLKSDPKMIVRLYGHTDTQGEEKDNYLLSYKRVRSVYSYLIRHGISRSRIQMKAFGETQTIWKDDHQEWAARENRRVEIVLWER